MTKPWWALGALGVLQVLDIVSTNLTPDLEINPVTLRLFDWLGAVWWTPKVALMLLIVAGVAFASRVPRRTLGLVIAGYTVAVSINLLNVVAIYLY